ncbi:MAG TPA: acyl-CoA synthetase [Acidimicrobiales bacterium]|nr:acyl-CoA synthetase [Acidimicrobiales bacterium]
MAGLNFADIFETVVDTTPDAPALVVLSTSGDEVRLTFAELDARVNRLANALLALGIRPGDHIGCHLYDGNQYVELTLAAFKVRAVPVNVNFRYVDEELEYLVDNADLVLVVTEPDLEDRAVRAAKRLDRPCTVVVADHRYEELLDEQPDRRPPADGRGPDDLYGLWTGGTTGMPKGVMWRHDDIYLSAVGGSGNPALGVAPVSDLDDVAARAAGGYPLKGTLTLCPLMHGGGWWVGFSALLSGATHVLIRDLGFDPGFALRVIAEEKVNVVMTIGDAYARPIVDHLEAQGTDEHDLSSLIVYGSGGAILSPSVKASLTALLPNLLVLDAFGASETGGQGALVGQSDDGAPVFAMDPTNVVIADDGTLCAPGDGRIGMLATSGHIPLRYHKDEAKTAATFPVVDGVRYAVPGDMAAVLADGTIAVYGRGSVSINTGGEKVFPEEVEKALKSHPAVFDAIVVGTPSERWGSQVTAVVELRPGLESPPDLGELRQHGRSHLAGYKLPREVVFVDAVRRSPSGKPDYRWAKDVAVAALEGSLTTG